MAEAAKSGMAAGDTDDAAAAPARVAELRTQLLRRAKDAVLGAVHAPPGAAAGGVAAGGVAAGEVAARAALATLAEHGLLSYSIPESGGGAALHGLARPDDVSVRALAWLRDELAYGDGLLDLMLVMQGLGSYPLARAGDPALARPILADVVAGRRIAGYCLTEPGAGSSLDEVATTAVRMGGGWQLDGLKTFISNAPIADFFTVLARTAGAPGDRCPGGLSMFYVPRATAGVRVEAFEVIAPHPIGEVHFDAVRVENGWLLGQEGAGLDLALATLSRFRTTVAAAANGFARRALDESRRHLASRRQFGRALGDNQGLRFDLAEMDTRLRAAQLLVAEAAACVDSGVDAGLEVARAKLFATEVAGWICDRAVQHHGGRGVRRGEVVESLYREVRSLRIYEGASEIQKLILGKLILARVGETPAG